MGQTLPNVVFISNFDYGTTEADLQARFGEFGEVADVRLVRDRDTGVSRGFAFVEMRNDRDAMLAIDQLNGAEWDGRRIRVSPAQERPRR